MVYITLNIRILVGLCLMYVRNTVRGVRCIFEVNWGNRMKCKLLLCITKGTKVNEVYVSTLP